MGAPLINLEQMVEDLFSVHIVPPAVLGEWRTTLKAVEEPSDLDAPIAMQTIDQTIAWSPEISCGDFYLASYRDFVATSDDFEMWGGWQTPAKAVTQIRTTIMGNLASLEAMVAVRGLEVAPEELVDRSTGLLTKRARELLLQVRGWGYEHVLERQMANKQISLALSATCGDFDIYSLKIR